jgi:putative intracellular protease/amidase
MELVMKQITILLTEGYSDWEIAPLSGTGRAFYGADIRFVSADGKSLKSAAGLSVVDLEKFEAPTKGVVVVCGGPTFESGSAPDISARLREARDSGCIIAGICGGTIALARAGMLDNVQHTSNGPGYLGKYVARYAGSDSYVDQPMALRAGDVITAPATAPATFAAEVLMAAGLDPQKADELRNMLAAEHSN